MNNDIEKALKSAIKTSDISYYRLAKDTGVEARSIGRFMAGETSLRLDVAAKLAKRLGLVLTHERN